ncbi:MAG TPA: FAD-dependent oxidoreductase [Roseiflexaceae bacterium]|nr:FAD-dependent oxidoreductase [Roseiflexaceae bacterium]
MVIIGGGVAGLTAAVHLAERGLRPVLLEATPTYLGGRLCDTPAVRFAHGGQEWHFPGEHGGHGIWAPYVNLRALLDRLGVHGIFRCSEEEAWIAGDGTRMRRAAIGSAIRGGVLPAPFHYLQLFARPRFLAMLTLRDLLALPRIFGALLAAMAVDPIAEQHPLKDTTLADFTTGWSPQLQRFFASLARSGLGAHPEQVPAAGFIAFLRFYTLLRRDAWAFSYLKTTGGTGIVTPLVAAITAHGGTIRQDARVIQLEQLPNGWQIHYQHGDSVQTIAARYVVLATDAPAAEQPLCSSTATAAAARALRFPAGVPTAIIRIWFATQPQRGPSSGIFSGDLLVDNFFWLDRLQDAYAAWRTTGGSALEMHIYGPAEVLDRPDAVLLAQARVDARRAFPELAGHVVHTILQRNPATHTRFAVGATTEHLAVATPWPGILACGDWVAHPTPSLYLERAVTTGMAAANAVLVATGQPQVVIEDPPGPEPLAAMIAAGMQRLRRRIRAR